MRRENAAMPRIKKWEHAQGAVHAQRLREEEGYGGDLSIGFTIEETPAQVDDTFLALEEHGQNVTGLIIDFSEHFTKHIITRVTRMLERFAENGWFDIDVVRLTGDSTTTPAEVARFMAVLSRFAIQVLGFQVFPHTVKTFSSFLPEMRALENLIITSSGKRNLMPLFSELSDYIRTPEAQHIGSMVGLEVFRIFEHFLAGTPRLRVFELFADYGLLPDEQMAVLCLLERMPRLIVWGMGIQSRGYGYGPNENANYDKIKSIRDERSVGLAWREFEVL